MLNNPPHVSFLVGAQRSGTTLLVRLLEQHPGVSIAKPVRPEPKFFLDPSFASTSPDDYLERFHGKDWQGKATCLLEKSTSYYEVGAVPDRIASFFPGAKVVFLLREPIARSISNFNFSADNGFEKRALEEVFSEKNFNRVPDLPVETSVNPFNYVGRGEYAHFIAKYIDVFGVNHVRICFFEELVKNFEEELIGLLSFLGISSSANSWVFPGKVNGSKNASELPPEIYRRLALHFTDHNHELEVLLGRRLPDSWYYNELNKQLIHNDMV